jgi:hypothetical protein
MSTPAVRLGSGSVPRRKYNAPCRLEARLADNHNKKRGTAVDP